jgi:hypothetical protein
LRPATDHHNAGIAVSCAANCPRLPAAGEAEYDDDTPSLAGFPTNSTREDALELVHLYAERGSPKFERAAMRWLERYLAEGTPRLQHFAEVAADLAGRDQVAAEP